MHVIHEMERAGADTPTPASCNLVNTAYPTPTPSNPGATNRPVHSAPPRFVRPTAPPGAGHCSQSIVGCCEDGETFNWKLADGTSTCPTSCSDPTSAYPCCPDGKTFNTHDNCPTNAPDLVTPAPDTAAPTPVPFIVSPPDTHSPTPTPTEPPTPAPTSTPTEEPTVEDTRGAPTLDPTEVPTRAPTPSPYQRMHANCGHMCMHIVHNAAERKCHPPLHRCVKMIAESIFRSTTRAAT